MRLGELCMASAAAMCALLPWTAQPRAMLRLRASCGVARGLGGDSRALSLSQVASQFGISN